MELLDHYAGIMLRYQLEDHDTANPAECFEVASKMLVERDKHVAPKKKGDRPTPLRNGPVRFNPLGKLNTPEVHAAFKDWQEMRARSKRHVTQRSAQRAVNKVHKLAGEDPDLAVAVINQAVDCGWTGFYPLSNNDKGSIGSKLERVAEKL